MSAIELVEKSQLAAAAGDEVWRHRPRARQSARGRQGAHPDLRRRRDRAAPGRHAGLVHGPESVVRSGRGAHLPAAFADDSEGRSRALGEGAAREAVLPARSEGQGRAHEGQRKASSDSQAARQAEGQSRLQPQASIEYGSRSRHAHAREHAAARRVRARGRRRRSGTRLPGRPRRRRRGGASSREAHSRGVATRSWCRRPSASGCSSASCATPSPGPSPRPIRPKSIASTSTRPRSAPCSARSSALAPLPDIVLVDAFRIPELPMAQRGVLHGDRRCSAIAAASIVAKVTRDRQMLDLHGRDPRYGFDRHKGYATADHLDAVARFGYSEAHRRSFRPATLFDTID